ncbi:DUF2141 domain-containing protein [Fibrisoma limi]|nr:DUF2141 domain-containing protein [Fibrisoma limi]
MPVFLLLLCGFLSTASTSLLTEKTKLHVDVQNIREAKGSIHIAIFKACDNFPNCKPLDFRLIKASTKSVETSFEVEPGNYAVAVYHDANANGVLDKRMFGIPKEPYGFSNNFRPVMSAPKFKDCEIQVGASDKAISIKLL